MSDGIYSSLSGAVATQHVIESLANNIANISTTGFKADRMTFKEIYSEASTACSVGNEGCRASDGNSQQRQVVIDSQLPDLKPGSIRVTGNPLDVAIPGSGFFVVQTTDGEKLTRAGVFRADAENRLTDMSGNLVMGEGGPIRLRVGSTRIDGDGVVWSDDVAVDRLRMQDVRDPKFLSRAGENLWTVEDKKNLIDLREFFLIPNSIEASNVSPVREMISLIQANRAYDSYIKSIEMMRAEDQRTATEITV